MSARSRTRATWLLPLLLGPLVALAAPRDLLILGWVESVQLIGPGLTLEAKLDTGAATSSLDARIVKKFRKGGKRWVRFGILDPRTGEEVMLVRERVRTIGVVQHEGENQVRPTVMMRMCVAGELLEVEVSLVDRSQFSYPLLLGRSALEKFALVDPGGIHLSEPGCRAGDGDEESGS